jgi:pantoate--beta-alanine ligase
MIAIHKTAAELVRQNYNVFVPTMGALHTGHQSLIEIGKSKGGKVLVSIFVNPLQFDKKSDLENYPKNYELDIELAEAAGAEGVFIPDQKEIYPGQILEISAGPIGELYEGKSRLNHCSGVLTVVKRLFELTNPRVAVFGEKDFQQLYLIKKMVNDFALPVKIVSGPIIRDSNGLALSSRNNLLTKDQLKSALVISRAISQSKLEDMYQEFKNESDFDLDYLEIIDEDSFLKADDSTNNKSVITAGWINQVRLIDNRPIREVS